MREVAMVRLTAAVLLTLGMVASTWADDWKPVADKMITRWGSEVTPANAWQQYPRPQLVREQWTNLNGLWDYAVTKDDAAQPTNWDGKILVPYAIESTLSGVGRLLDPSEALWYHHSFKHDLAEGNRLHLNFEAVDYDCTVTLNGKQVGQHRGGSDPFAIDVTDALQSGDNELIVKVIDRTGDFQLRGKQVRDPKGIWYTRTSGIWQTVWLEDVPAQHIASLKIDTNAEAGTIDVAASLGGASDKAATVRVTASLDGKEVGQVTTQGGKSVQLKIADAKLWSPASPTLYDLKVEVLAGDKVVDSVTSYAGIRTVGKMQDDNGNWQMTLNGKPVFHWGVLDQGWWPDGLLTPPSDEAMVYDVEFLKQAGFNFIRKHIKVEPRRFYAACDRLGMMVWQDQPSTTDGGPEWTRLRENPRDGDWPEDAHKQFMVELERMMDGLHNHPSIVVWVPFNEAWGQHRTVEVGKWVVEHDKSRLVNVASGGNFWPVGDIADEHAYPDPKFPLNNKRFDDFVKVVGEFGGHGWPVEGHLWQPDKRNWGYGDLPKTAEEYTQRYVRTANQLGELRQRGVAGGLYTQTTDVEGEVNGLMTYDRAVEKIAPAELLKIHEAAGLTD